MTILLSVCELLAQVWHVQILQPEKRIREQHWRVELCCSNSGEWVVLIGIYKVQGLGGNILVLGVLLLVHW